MGELLPSEPAGLADRINAEHAAVLVGARMALEHARAAGELLLEARHRCPYGTWLPWLREHVTFSERTAQSYMRVARRWPELEAQNAQSAADLSLDGALRLLAAPTPPDAEPDEPPSRSSSEGTRSKKLENGAGCTCDWDDARWRSEARLPPREPIDVAEFLRFVNDGEVPAVAQTTAAEWQRMCDWLLRPDRPRRLPCCDQRGATEAVRMAHQLADLAGRWPAVPIREVTILWGGVDVIRLLADSLMYGELEGGQAALRRLWPLLSRRVVVAGA